MKIIQISPSFLPHKGGVEAHVQKVSEALIAFGHQVEIISWEEGCLVNKAYQHKQWQTQITAVDQIDDKLEVTNKLSVWKQIYAFLPLLKSADVIQVHDVAWWLLPVWPFLYRKIFITFHGWEGIYPVPWKNIWQRKFFGQFAKGVVHVGHFIQKFYGDKPDLVTYGGVDPQLNFPKRQLKPKQFSIVFTGRLVEENEIEKYFETIEYLRQTNTHIKVVWVGDGPYHQLCAQVGKVTGMIDQKSIMRYLQTADLVFASSYLSILTAQAMGKLVVAFFSHALKASYLRDYPGAKFMILAKEPRKLVKQLNHLSGSQQQKMSRDASRWANQQTWPKLAEAYLALWRQKLN